jgi:hypothetical protein
VKKRTATRQQARGRPAGMRLQVPTLAKETFNLRHPLGSRGGRGGSLRLVGTRQTGTISV